MTNKAWLGIGAVAVTLVASGTVLAQQRVLAEATLVHQDDCIDSEVEIFVQANSANRGTFEVSAFEIDTCAEEDGVLLDARGRGNLAQGGFSFDGRRAVLNTTVQLRDALTRNAVSMELDLTWVGGEQVVATTRRDIQSRGRFARANRGLTRTLAEAEASGTVAVDGRGLFDGSSDDATIWTIR